MRRLGITREYVLELDDERYHLSGRRLEAVERVSDVEGDKWIVSDFEGAAPQVMTVDAPMKYVDAVIEKRLRESGALVGGNRVLVFRKRPRGTRATEAYFVSVSAALYAKYAAAAEDDECHQLLFAAPMFLSRELDSLRSSKPVAVLFSHGRHVDVVVGDARRTYGAFRASWHRSSEDRARLIENLRDGLRGIEQKNNIRLQALHCHHWLLEDEADAEWTASLAEALDVSLVAGKLERVKSGARRYSSSVPALLGKLSIADSVSAPKQKNFYRAQVALPWAAAALVAITLIGLAASAFWTQQAYSLRSRSAAIEAALQPPEPAPEVLRAAYEKPLALADTLGRAQLAPSLERVLAQISASVSKHITFDEVVIEYPDDKAVVRLTLLGQSLEPAQGEGVPAFNAFLAALRQRGYALIKSDLKTNVESLSFLVQLERGLN